MPMPTTDLVVLDPGMTMLPGHHYAYNSAIRDCCAEKQLNCLFLFNRRTPAELLSEFSHALPVFGFWHYDHGFPDPVSGPLEEFLCRSQVMLANLHSSLTPRVTARTVVLKHSCGLYSVYALAQWYASLDDAQKPRLALNLFDYTDSDLFRACLRMSWKLFDSDNRVRLYAGCHGVAEKLAPVTGAPVPVLPAPLRFGRRISAHTPGRPLVFGFCGEGRPDKNLHILAAAIQRYLETGGTGSFSLQVMPTSTDVQEAMLALHALSVAWPDKVQLAIGHVDADRYYEILRGFDVIMLPYANAAPRYRSSGVIQEALALGVTPVALQGGMPVLEAAAVGAGVLPLPELSPAALCVALHIGEKNAAVVREKSLTAAEPYRAYHNAENLVDTLFELPGACELLYRNLL